jgi:hypothetical protein
MYSPRSMEMHPWTPYSSSGFTNGCRHWSYVYTWPQSPPLSQQRVSFRPPTILSTREEKINPCHGSECVTVIRNPFCVVRWCYSPVLWYPCLKSPRWKFNGPWQRRVVAPQAARTSLLVAGVVQWLCIVLNRWQTKPNFHASCIAIINKQGSAAVVHHSLVHTIVMMILKRIKMPSIKTKGCLLCISSGKKSCRVELVGLCVRCWFYILHFRSKVSD